MKVMTHLGLVIWEMALWEDNLLLTKLGCRSKRKRGITVGKMPFVLQEEDKWVLH